MMHTDGEQMPTLELSISANGDSKKSSLLAQLKTSVTAPYGHPVVLAVSPIGKMISVFVVTLYDD